MTHPTDATPSTAGAGHSSEGRRRPGEAECSGDSADREQREREQMDRAESELHEDGKERDVHQQMAALVTLGVSET